MEQPQRSEGDYPAGIPASRAQSRTDAITEGALRHAIAEGELFLEYQPKVALATDRIVGNEALLRWKHPQLGVVSPLEFIPLAEATGLIVPIGSWVIAEACRQASTWATTPHRRSLSMCVNVSARQFDGNLGDVIETALETSGLEPELLFLEVTETVLMRDVEHTRHTLRAVAERGVRLSIDDFGTGYSSLAYLKQFRIDELKVDKTFVDGLGRDPRDTAIIAAVVGMAHALDVAVLAEGVETPEQLGRLRTLGCELVQGFLFSGPLDPPTLEPLLRADNAAGLSRHGNDESYRPDRVLVIDDTDEVRHLARMSLSTVGFEVHEASGGREGLRLAAAIQPHCIVLDVSMPDMSGLDVCRALREDPRTADCAIVMLTASTNTVDKVTAFSRGADDYMVKPFSPRELANRVREAMRRRPAFRRE